MVFVMELMKLFFLKNIQEKDIHNLIIKQNLYSFCFKKIIIFFLYRRHIYSVFTGCIRCRILGASVTNAFTCLGALEYCTMLSLSSVIHTINNNMVNWFGWVKVKLSVLLTHLLLYKDEFIWNKNSLYN